MWVQLVAVLLSGPDKPEVDEVLTALHVAIAQSLRST